MNTSNSYNLLACFKYDISVALIDLSITNIRFHQVMTGTIAFSGYIILME